MRSNVMRQKQRRRLIAQKRHEQKAVIDSRKPKKVVHTKFNLLNQLEKLKLKASNAAYLVDIQIAEKKKQTWRAIACFIILIIAITRLYIFGSGIMNTLIIIFVSYQMLLSLFRYRISHEIYKGWKISHHLHLVQIEDCYEELSPQGATI